MNPAGSDGWSVVSQNWAWMNIDMLSWEEKTPTTKIQRGCWPYNLLNTLRLRQNGCYFAAFISTSLSWMKRFYFLIQISLKLLAKSLWHSTHRFTVQSAWFLKMTCHLFGTRLSTTIIRMQVIQHIRSSAVMKRPNITWFCIWYDNDWGKICAEIIFIKDTPCLALMGELWGIFGEDLSENLLRYKGTHCIRIALMEKGGGWVGGVGGHFKNAFELLKFQCRIKIISFNVWVRYFVWNFKGYLWNSTQNILPIHRKMWILFTGENLRALRFKSS